MNDITNMLPEENIEGNKIIAELMGYTIGNLSGWLSGTKVYAYKKLDGSITEAHYVNDLKFQTSMDWLFPVLEKIESLGHKWEIGMSEESPYHYCKIWSIGIIEGISPKDAIYGAVLEFAKWFKANNK